jgi:hypothetical protein
MKAFQAFVEWYCKKEGLDKKVYFRHLQKTWIAAKHWVIKFGEDFYSRYKKEGWEDMVDSCKNKIIPWCEGYEDE